MLRFLFVLIVGFLAQYIDGLLGMGYGVFSTSLLLTIGLLPALISASVHTAEIFASLASGLSHLGFKNVKRNIAEPLIVGGVIGGIIGSYFLTSVPGDLIKPFITILLLFQGIRILKNFLRKRVSLGKGNFSKKFLLLLGFVGGCIDAVGGGGWGPICTSTLVVMNKKHPRHIIGSVNFAEFFVTIVIVLTFGITLGFENFLWNIVIPLAIGCIIAAPVAAYTCKRVPQSVLGVLVGILLIITNLRTLIVILL